MIEIKSMTRNLRPLMDDCKLLTEVLKTHDLKTYAQISMTNSGPKPENEPRQLSAIAILPRVSSFKMFLHHSRRRKISNDYENVRVTFHLNRTIEIKVHSNFRTLV